MNILEKFVMGIGFIAGIIFLGGIIQIAYAIFEIVKSY